MQLFDIVAQKRKLHESVPLPSVLSHIVVNYTTFPIYHSVCYEMERDECFVAIVNSDIYTCVYTHPDWTLYRNHIPLPFTFRHRILDIKRVKKDLFVVYDNGIDALLTDLVHNKGVRLHTINLPVVHNETLYYMRGNNYYREVEVRLKDIEKHMGHWRVIGNCMSLSNLNHETQFMGETEVYDGCALYKWNDVIYVIRSYEIVSPNRTVRLSSYPQLIEANDHILVVRTHEQYVIWDLKQDLVTRCQLPELQVTHDGLFREEMVEGRNRVHLYR